MTRSKDKGTAAETGVVNALIRLGWPHAERRTLSGANDKGDVSGVIGICFEVKDTNSWQVPAWWRETEVERLNAAADFGILVIKVPGIGHANAEKWITVMERDAAELLRLRGWVADQLTDGFTEVPTRMRSVEMGAVGIKKALAELKERERHCGTTPVTVTFRGKNMPDYPQLDYNIMRLDARCSLLLDAGYGNVR